jgi:flagellum-specific peptidoglycan hydrolase FlgJ
MAPALFFKMYAGYAVNSQIKHGVPASITLAQAALESAWGESRLTKEANNFFGIKDHTNDSWRGPNYGIDTAEYIGGQRVMVKAYFRKYNSPQGSFDDHADFLKVNKRYRSLFDLPITDFTAWARGLKAAGYATDPGYADKLINMVIKYNLQQYDEQGEQKKKYLP